MDEYEGLEFDYREELQKKPTIEQVISALKSFDGGVPGRDLIYGLSERTEAEINELRAAWQAMNDADRRLLLQNMVEASEANFDLNFDTFSFEAMLDEDAAIRALAIELLWENESLSLLGKLLKLATDDEDWQVRAEAVKSLGKFILLGELGKLRETEALRAQECVIQILADTSEDVEVRRRALEAIANCSHELVPQAIQDAYESHEHAMQISAIFAMGRSCDSRWNEKILHELLNSDPERRFEAVRAAGELQIEESVPDLIRAWYDSDRETGEVIVWSLGEIGSNEAIRVLERIQSEVDESDEDMQEAIEDSLGNAQLMQGNHSFFRDADD